MCDPEGVAERERERVCGAAGGGVLSPCRWGEVGREKTPQALSSPPPRTLSQLTRYRLSTSGTCVPRTGWLTSGYRSDSQR